MWVKRYTAGEPEGTNASQMPAHVKAEGDRLHVSWKYLEKLME